MRTVNALIRLGDAQADLSLRWVHRSYCWFGPAQAHIVNVPCHQKRNLSIVWFVNLQIRMSRNLDAYCLCGSTRSC